MPDGAWGSARQPSAGGHRGSTARGPGTAARGAGGVPRLLRAPRPPCGHFVPASCPAPDLSLQHACLDGRRAEPRVPPAKTQARKSYQKNNEFTKIENNYSRVGGAGGRLTGRSRAGELAWRPHPPAGAAGAAPPPRPAGSPRSPCHRPWAGPGPRAASPGLLQDKHGEGPRPRLSDGRARTLVGRETHQHLNE